MPALLRTHRRMLACDRIVYRRSRFQQRRSTKFSEDFGLRDAHKNFTEKLGAIPFMHEFARTVNFSFFGFGLLIGVISGVASALMAFPGIRFGKMFRDAKEQAVTERNPTGVMLCSISFMMPAVLCHLLMPAVRENLWVEGDNGRHVLSLWLIC